MGDNPDQGVQFKAEQVIRQRLEARTDEIRSAVIEQIERAAAYGVEQLREAQERELDALKAGIPSSIVDFLGRGGQVSVVEVTGGDSLINEVMRVTVQNQNNYDRRVFYMGGVRRWRVTILVEPITPSDAADAIK